MAGRHAHAKQWKRQRRQLKFPRTRPGRPERGIRRKIAGEAALREVFAIPLSRAAQIGSRQQRQRGRKLHSPHAPEAGRIAKGKARKPYESGCKVSITTTNARSPGGRFVLHAKAFHRRPYDGHTLGCVLTGTQALTGIEIKRSRAAGPPRPQRAQAPARLALRTETRRPRPDQEGAAPPGRHRAGHRTPQVRGPPRPERPERPRRRSRQRRPHRRRTQLPPNPAMAEKPLA